MNDMPIRINTDVRNDIIKESMILLVLSCSIYRTKYHKGVVMKMRQVLITINEKTLRQI